MNTQTVDILSTLQNQGLGRTLSPNASGILNEIKESRRVSTTEMVNLIEPHSRKGLVFTVAIKILTNVFSRYDISIVYAPSPIKLRLDSTENLPSSLPKKKASKSGDLKFRSLTVKKKTEDFLKLFNTVPRKDKLTLLDIEPDKKSLPRGDIDNAVMDNVWYDHALDGSIDLVAIYLKEIGKFKLLKPAEELELIKLVHEGDREAWDKFIHANLRLVIWNARRFLGRIKADPSKDLNDLIQEGNRGLIKALGRFEPLKGFKFSTYATWWIRQFIGKSVDDESRTVRLPVNVSGEIRKYLKTYNMLSHTYGEQVPLEEVAKEMQIKLDKVYDLRRIIVQSFISVDGFKQNTDDDRPSFFIKDLEKTPDQTLHEKQVSQIIRKALKMALSPREYEIIKFRFGLDNNEPHSLEAIGEKFTLTKQAIHVIEQKALEKMSHNPEIIRLAKSMNFKVKNLIK